MSTKTTFKRVALVAAVAAAFAGLSTVAANADTKPSLSAATAGANQTATATVGGYVSESITAGTQDSYYTISNSGVGSVLYPTLGSSATTTLTAASATSEIWSDGSGAIGAVTHAAGGTTAWGTGTAAGVLTFSVYSATAGTQTLTVTGSNSAAQTLTITWAAAPALSVANSLVVANNNAHATGTWATSTADTGLSYPSTYGNVIGGIYVELKNNASSPADYTSDKIEAKITSGAAILKLAAASTGLSTASAGTDVIAASTGAIGYVQVLSTGTSGLVTVQISDNTTGTVLGSTVFTLVGTTPASLKLVAQNNKVASTGAALGGTPSSTTGSSALTVSVLDSNGNPVTSSTGTSTAYGHAGSATAAGFWAVSDNTACFQSVVNNASDGAASPSSTQNGLGTYELQLIAANNAASGCTANVTIKLTLADNTTVVSLAPVSVAVGGTTIASVALTPDQASYAPGQKVTFTLTAKDASGNAVADNTYGVWANSGTQIPSTGFSPVSANVSLTSLPFTNAYAASTNEGYSFVGGVATSSTYAPYTDGTVNLTSTLGGSTSGLVTALQGTTLAGSFSVTTGASAASSAATDAANEATDAANAATDAANAAADAADAATSAAQDASAKADAALAAVNALSAKITVLAAQIAKIVKKLGA